MRIEIHEAGGRHITIPIPGFLISPGMIRFGLSIGRRYVGDDMPRIPEEAMDILCNALNAVKQKYGTWELVNVESASGDLVRIIL